MLSLLSRVSLALNFLSWEIEKSRNRDWARVGSTEKKIPFGASNPNYGLGKLLKTAEIEAKISATGFSHGFTRLLTDTIL